MIVIENSKTQRTPKTMTTNDIPVGQVFRGEIFGKRSLRWEKGLFYKAQGPHRIVSDLPTPQHYDLIIVRLDAAGTRETGYSNLYLKCSEVRDYEPVIAHITLTPQV